MGEHAWVGYAMTFLLTVITALIALLAWFCRQTWAEQKETNRGFREAIEKLWNGISGRVSIDVCTERCGANRVHIESLELDFRRHSHTALPQDTNIVFKE